MERDPRRKEIFEKAKRFEEDVADLFRLQGYKATVGYEYQAMQFDVRLELAVGLLKIRALVECKDYTRKVNQKDVREFAYKVDSVNRDERGPNPYQGIFIARSGFDDNAHEMARIHNVQLQTLHDLLLSLVDLHPNLDAAIRGFQGTPLEALYVEQEAVLETDIRPGEVLEPKGLTETVLQWLERPGSTSLTLLGDFGCGKTSFCRRLAAELAVKSKENPGQVRMPILIDLREGGSTTVTLENLLTHHFQRLSSQPVNPQALLHLNREGYLLLIFDGFDETIAYSEPSRYLENLRQILRAAEGKAKVLLTCRTHYFRDRPEVLKRLGRIPEMMSSLGATRLYEELQERAGTEIGYVLEFREPQIAAYLKKALSPPADWHDFREQIRRTYNLNELAERPFLLEIIVKTLPRLTEKGTAVSLTDLYETYCQSWFDHTDFRLRLTRDKKIVIVEYLARLIWDSPENRIHYTVLADKVVELFRDQPLTGYDKEQIDYEVRTALFLRRDAEGYYSFIHRSFLEFFIARSIRAGLAAGEPGCLHLKRITREVVFFLEFWPEAQKIQKLARKVLEGTYQPGISENALILLYFHARAQFGPLIGSTTEKAIDLLRLRESFGKMRPEVIHLEGADLSGALLAGVDLSRAGLEGTDLNQADLRQSFLEAVRLARGKLGFADLRKASATSADLTETDLSHADAQEAILNGAILNGADLSFGRFTRAQLKTARLDGIETIGTGMLGAALPARASLAASAGCKDSHDLNWRFQAGHSGSINSIVWHPDSHCIATGAGDGTIKLWEPRTGKMLLTLEDHENSVQSVAWSPDGKTIASGSNDKTVRLWTSNDGQLLNSLTAHKGAVLTVAWAPDGQSIASGSLDGTIRLWGSSDGRFLNYLQGHEGGVFAVSWSPDGKILASGSYDKTIRLWDPSSGRLLKIFRGHEDLIHSVSWAPNGKTLASGSYDKTVRLWDPNDGRLLNTLQGHEDLVQAVSWAPNGKALASGSYDKTVKLWNPSNGRLLNTLQGHEDLVRAVSWAPDGNTLASGSADRIVKLWDSSDGSLLNTIQGHKTLIRAVSSSPDGNTLASGSYDNTVRLWDPSDGRLLNTLQGHEHEVLAVSWAPDGNTLASGSGDYTVKLWDPQTGQLLNTLRGHNYWVRAISWAPDGKALASASDDQTVRLWNLSDGRPLNTLQGHEHWVVAVSWAPDGRTLASGSHDKTVRLWDPVPGKLLSSLEGHESFVTAISWAPDGKILASGSHDKTVKLWDPLDGRLLSTLPGHANEVLAVSWAPDGKTLASGSHDRTVKFWDPLGGRLLRTLEVGYSLSSMSWERGSRRLVLGFGTGYIEIWDLTSDPPRPLARFYNTPNGSGFAVTPDGYVSGPPEALEYVRFGDGWALYDLTDVPERFSPEKVKAALASGRGTAAGKRRRKRS